MPRTRTSPASSPAKAKPPSDSAAAAAKASPNEARKSPPEADPPSLAPPKYGEVMPDREHWWGPEELKLRIENPPEGKELMARVVTFDNTNPLRELLLFAPGIDRVRSKLDGKRSTLTTVAKSTKSVEEGGGGRGPSADRAAAEEAEESEEDHGEEADQRNEQEAEEGP